MDLNNDGVMAAVAAAVASFTMSALGMAATTLGMPPPSRREVMRAVLEGLIGVPMALVFGYGFGAPMAAALEQLAAAVPMVHLVLKLDPLAGGLVVGVAVLKVVPLLPEIAAGLARKYAPKTGGAQ